MRSKWLLGLIATLATMIGMLISVSGAAAQAPPSGPSTDPMTTNVPFLAWRGEEIRFTKCYWASEPDYNISSDVVADPSLFFQRYTADFQVVDWTGDPNFKPVAETGTFVAFNFRDVICVRGDMTSQRPGLAQIKLIITDKAGNIVAPKHDYLAIWMSLTAPVIAEQPYGGDPAGDGIFNPPFENGLVSVRVKGTFPDSIAGKTWTLPDDWASLAAAYAVDGSFPDGYVTPGPLQGLGPASRWDIHDSLSWDPAQAGTQHVPGACGGVAATDTVDNCLGGSSNFSRLYGDMTGYGTIGPFDPMRADETLLPDGVLDAGDAPMPAARIDVYLAGTAGALDPASKSVVYSRNGTGAATPHNLYAPFYQTYIPATEAGPFASGIDGPPIGNNFPGFMGSGVYSYWDTISMHSRGGYNACRDTLGNLIPKPTGDDHVVVFTDEHGEAMVEYDPYVGFTLSPDANNRCYEITQPTTFNSTIQAEAKYPFQPVLGSGPFWSDTLNKVVNTTPSKTLSCVAKGLNEMFCVETILDWEGNPVAGAPVKFSRTPLGNIEPDAAKFGGFDTTGQTLVSADLSGVTLRTNSLGQAGALVTESLAGQCVDVKADNLGTMYTPQNPGIKLFAGVTPASGTVGCGGTGGTTSTSSSSTTTTTSAGPGSSPSTPPASSQTSAPASQSAGQVALPGSKSTPAASSKVAKPASIVMTKVKMVKHSRYLYVKVRSAAKTVKLKVTLINKQHKVIGKTQIRYVKANKLVKVGHLTLSKKVASVRVAVA